MTLAVTITHHGLAECISAKNAGIKAKIAKISVGDQSYTPSPSQQALRNERQIEDIIQCVNVSDTSLQMAAKFSGDKEFPIGEIALWLESGTLLGVISEPNRTLTYKSKGAHVIVPFTMNFEALPSDSLTVVVGTENLNIMIDEEFETLSAGVIETHCLLVDHTFQLQELDQNVEGLATHQAAFEANTQANFQRQNQAVKQVEIGLGDTSNTQNEVVTELATNLVENAHLNIEQELRLHDLDHQIELLEDKQSNDSNPLPDLNRFALTKYFKSGFSSTDNASDAHYERSRIGKDSPISVGKTTFKIAGCGSMAFISGCIYIHGFSISGNHDHGFEVVVSKAALAKALRGAGITHFSEAYSTGVVEWYVGKDCDGEDLSPQVVPVVAKNNETISIKTHQLDARSHANIYKEVHSAKIWFTVPVLNPVYA
ncbi:hypothetical protein [Vibrio lentus]|uniref:hypothetical protein n=1 Tax=Vibrio lentus TaxID=136468 RepID=UPI000CA8286D|nr:hypothetical protein [Vibrio lentus]PMG66758.1 hypothetical protein BCU86_12850 [Vibrio lentus]